MLARSAANTNKIAAKGCNYCSDQRFNIQYAASTVQTTPKHYIERENAKRDKIKLTCQKQNILYIWSRPPHDLPSIYIWHIMTYIFVFLLGSNPTLLLHFCACLRKSQHVFSRLKPKANPKPTLNKPQSLLKYTPTKPTLTKQTLNKNLNQPWINPKPT
jgi:hypothetical protein